MAFSFHHLKVDYKDGDKWSLKAPDMLEFKQLLQNWQEQMQVADGWNALVLNNHDQPRAISRFGDDERYAKESGKMLAMLLHLMRGTPYVYQGEEIGTPNAGFTDIGMYQDVGSKNYFRILCEGGATEEEALQILRERSRDNGRTPMLWTEDATGGFTTGTPWLSLPKNRTGISVAAQQEDHTSILQFYRRLIALRKREAIIAEGEIRFLPSADGVIAYERTLFEQRMVVCCNTTKEPQAFPNLDLDGLEVVLNSYDDGQIGPQLQPFQGIAWMNT